MNSENKGIRIDDYYTPNMMDNDFNILDLDFDNYDLIVVHKSSLEGIKMESMQFAELVQKQRIILCTIHYLIKIVNQNLNSDKFFGFYISILLCNNIFEKIYYCYIWQSLNGF